MFTGSFLRDIGDIQGIIECAKKASALLQENNVQLTLDSSCRTERVKASFCSFHTTSIVEREHGLRVIPYQVVTLLLFVGSQNQTNTGLSLNSVPLIALGRDPHHVC